MNRFRMNLGPAVSSAPSLQFPPLIRADVVDAMKPQKRTTWQQHVDFYDALERLNETIGIAYSFAIDTDPLIDRLDLTTVAGLIEADKRIADAIKAHKPQPHVTLKPEPVKEVKPAISRLTTVRGE